MQGVLGGRRKNWGRTKEREAKEWSVAVPLLLKGKKGGRRRMGGLSQVLKSKGTVLLLDKNQLRKKKKEGLQANA